MASAQHGILDHPVLVGLTHGLGAAADAELAMDVRQVVLDRLLGEPELACHPLVRLTSCERAKDFDLSRRQIPRRLHRSGGTAVRARVRASAVSSARASASSAVNR